jgi:hypothetical protein
VRALSQRIPPVQTPDEMLADVGAKTARLHDVADRIYSQWVKGLVR